jgi:hypothetical protein
MFPGVVGRFVGLDFHQKIQTTTTPSLGFTQSPIHRPPTFNFPKFERKGPDF